MTSIAAPQIAEGGQSPNGDSPLSCQSGGLTRTGLPVPMEPALAASAGRMPKRSCRGVSEGQDARSERPATWHGQPRPGHSTSRSEARS